METFGIEELYKLAIAKGIEEAASRIATQGVLIAIGALAFWLALSYAIKSRILLVLAVIFASIGYGIPQIGSDTLASNVAQEVAGIAIEEGVDTARKAQATEMQYIHAAVSEVGLDTIKCQRTVNYLGECSKETGYYSSREINVRQVPYQDCKTDSKGKRTCTTKYRRESDTEYTPWFAFIQKHWIVADTKTKYLHRELYGLQDAADNDKPKVYLHSDWRAPEDYANHWYEFALFRPSPDQFVSRVPEFWKRAQTAMKNGGPVVVANFIGPYYHWALAADSVQFSEWSGHYTRLKSLVKLPGQNGASFSFKDAFKQPTTVKTQLYSADDDLALDFTGVTVLCGSFAPEDVKAMEAKAAVFQGYVGPSKQASVRWFVVCESVVQKMGGLINTSQALKVYLADASVWGKFKLAKNLLVGVVSVSDDGRYITGRSMETGMPNGNVLVKQDVRMSIAGGQQIPFTLDNLFGQFTGVYNLTGGYSYSDMSAAGSFIGLWYKDDPNYKAPDPSDPKCGEPKADHHGYIRPRMCKWQFLEDTIKINKEGALYIMDQVVDNVANRITYGWSIVILCIGFVAGAIIVALSLNNSRR